MMAKNTATSALPRVSDHAPEGSWEAFLYEILMLDHLRRQREEEEERAARKASAAATISASSLSQEVTL